MLLVFEDFPKNIVRNWKSVRQIFNQGQLKTITLIKLKTIWRKIARKYSILDMNLECVLRLFVCLSSSYWIAKSLVVPKNIPQKRYGHVDRDFDSLEQVRSTCAYCMEKYLNADEIPDCLRRPMVMQWFHEVCFLTNSDFLTN